jgi:hypothetical protein
MPRTSITVPASSSPSPMGFTVEIPLATAFAWQPLGLNLLIEVVKRTPSPFEYRVDAGDGLQTAMVIGAPDTAASGTVHRGSGPAIGLRSASGAQPVLLAVGRPIVSPAAPAGRGQIETRVWQARPSAPLVFFFGVSDRIWNGVTLPFPLAVLGAGRCQLLTSIDLSVARQADAAGVASFAFPNGDLSMLAQSLFVQAAVLDPGANTQGVAYSQAIRITFGNYDTVP